MHRWTLETGERMEGLQVFGELLPHLQWSLK